MKEQFSDWPVGLLVISRTDNLRNQQRNNLHTKKRALKEWEAKIFGKTLFYL